MITSGTEFGMRLMKVVGAQAGVTYLSSPISTGYRDLCLMRELGVTKQALRDRFPKEYREQVIGPNEREAHKFAQMVRRLEGREVVINPGDLFVPEWTQADYIAFWEETIRNYCVEIALSPGWEFSVGARFEVSLGLQTNLRLVDIRGRELSVHDLQALDAQARDRLQRENFDPEMINDYMPWIDFVSLSLAPAQLADNMRALSDIAAQCNQAAMKRKQDRTEQDGEHGKS